MSQENQSTTALGQAEVKENEVLSMFFDDEFVPHAFLDALFSSSLNVKPSMVTTTTSSSTTGSNGRQVIQKEFASQASLKALQNKNSSLLNHLDYYTNELTRQFEQKLSNLQNASSVISYSSGDNGNGVVGITRLEYYIENLSSSVNSLHRDLNEINSKIGEIQNGKQKVNGNRAGEGESQQQDDDEISASDISSHHTSTVRDLNDLLLIKSRLQSVIDIFELAKAIVTTSSDSDFSSNVKMANTASETQQDENNTISISIETFASSLNIFEETILEELHKDRTGTGNNSAESLLQRCDSLIELLPLFKNMKNYYPAYLRFVQFLDAEKKRFLSR